MVGSEDGLGGALTAEFPVGPGIAAILRVSFADGSGFLGVLESGTFLTSEYRRFGFRLGGEGLDDGVHAEYWDGESMSVLEPATGSFVTVADTDYYIILANEGERFQFAVWPTGGNPIAGELETFGPDWVRDDWRMYVGVDTASASIYEAWTVEFLGLSPLGGRGS